MTYTLRPNWRAAYGPLDMPMPNDGVGNPLVMPPFPAVHEDMEDCINADGTHGPVSTYSPGGSGICFGYSVQDPANVLLLESATNKRPEWYNFEHWVRQFRYAIARTEMVRDTIGPRRVLQYANYAHSVYDERGPVYFGPGWIPNNIHQFHEQAILTPHVGCGANLRELGWVAYCEAMALKLDKNRPTDWADMFLDTCNLAAFPGTGQIGSSPNSGGEATTPVNVQYTFHWGILVHGALALCHRLKRSVPYWVLEGMQATMALPAMPYAGVPSMPSFTYSEGGVLKAATGPGQHGDPAFGWWSSNCAALYKITGDAVWLDRALLYGPHTATDEQSRKFTMLRRGFP